MSKMQVPMAKEEREMLLRLVRERFELQHDFCCLRSATADAIMWAGWLYFTETRH
jgi:hypothetical protein